MCQARVCSHDPIERTGFDSIQQPTLSLRQSEIMIVAATLCVNFLLAKVERPLHRLAIRLQCFFQNFAQNRAPFSPNEAPSTQTTISTCQEACLRL